MKLLGIRYKSEICHKEYRSKAALQIRDIMKKSEELKTSAKNNTEQDFEFAYYDHVDDALIEGLEQNQDFFTLLLQNDEIKREVLGLFVSDTYESLKGVV